MNICFFKGRIVSTLDFKFIISKELSFKKLEHYSICKCDLELENKTIVKLKAYDKLADWCYRNLQENNIVFIYGKLNDEIEIEVFYCRVIN